MARVVVTKELALLVWEDLEGQKKPVEIAAEQGVSERTVQRLGTAITGFQNHRPDGEIAMATGWSRQRILELKGYWREDLDSHPKMVGPQRQAVASGPRRVQQNTLQGWVQLEDVKDLLLGLKLELAPFLSSFPTVWKGFHPDPSNRLKWVGEGDSKKIVWNLGVEQDYRWAPIAEGLQIFVPGVASDLQGIKDSFASYCQILVEEEDRYLEQAEEVRLRLGEANLNRSHYYRSILAEIDRDHSKPGEQDYRLVYSPKSEVQIAFDGVLLLESETEDEAISWITCHIQWRREFWDQHHQNLARLRGEVRNGVERLTRTLEELLTRSLYVGRQR